MVSTNQFKNGMHIEVESQIYKILEFQHVKPGKGGAFVRTKLRRLDGAVLDKTFRAGEKFRPIHTEVQKVQFLYKDRANAHFMDLGSYEQFSLNEQQLAEELKWIVPAQETNLVVVDGNPTGLQVPPAVELTVSETEPGVRGDTASGSGTKSAVLETGARLKVPLFINTGDRVKVDTRSGEYISRA